MSREERRSLILSAAIRLFSERGFRGITTREVAVAAGVSEAAIYHHFPTKAELYAAALECKAKQAWRGWPDEALSEMADGRDDEALLNSVALYLSEHYRRDPEFLRLMLYSALEGHAWARNFYETATRPVCVFLVDYFRGRQGEGICTRFDAQAAASEFVAMQVYRAVFEALFASEGAVNILCGSPTVFTGIFLAAIHRTIEENPPGALFLRD